MQGKIVESEELVEILGKEKHKRTVFTNGVFDILHVGHVRYLKEAKKLGDILVVGVNSDSSVKKIKGENRPVMGELERMELVAALKCVDYVVLFQEETPERLISLLKPQIHVKGGDYKLDELPEKKIVEGYGGRVVLVPEVEGYATTNIIERIQSRYKENV